MKLNLKQSKIFFYTFFLAFVLNIQASEIPDIIETKVENPKSVVFIGNSFFYYNNGIHKPTLGMVKANKDLGKGHRFRNITINSSSLEWHNVESYVTNEKIGSFSITSKNKYKRYDPENYQLAILMDCSQCPIHPDRKDLFNFYVDEHSDTLKRYGVEPSLMMTWAYKDKPEMTKSLASAYITAGNRNGIMVFPVGLAFQRSQKANPDIELYTPDKRHPSKAGTYLMAAVIYASIYKVSPVGNSYDYGLGRNIQNRLQKTAWETLSYYKNK